VPALPVRPFPRSLATPTVRGRAGFAGAAGSALAEPFHAR
jgi:hypothetical protein